MHKGWRALGLGLLAGALAALAMPPLYWLPFGLAGLVVFVWQWDRAETPRAALLRGWAWGFGHFVVGSYWIVEAFYVPPAEYGPLGVPIVTGLAVVLGFFPGLAAGVARWLVQRWPHLGGRYRRLLLLALCWTVAEWLRGHVFTGYPWNPLGHVWAFATPLLQGAALVGVYGLGTLSFLVLTAPMAGWRAMAAALLVLLLGGFLGNQTMLGPTGPDGPLIRIVQPNTPQAEKWLPAGRDQQLRKLIELSRQPGFDRLAAVVWPETAVPFILTPSSSALALMATAVPPSGYLLTGAARATDRIENGVWNSLLVVTAQGRIAASYDKVHLVPLGEYIPFHRQLAPVSGMIGRGSFEEGSGPATLALPGLPPFSPSICYEAIFPAAITDSARRARWLLNVTNDAWFGVSTGPYQHLTSARMRSVEEGLPMLRAANTGISAVIDGYGRVLASLDMEQQGVIDHALPPARAATPYSRWGDGLLALMVLILVVPLALKWPQKNVVVR